MDELQGSLQTNIDPQSYFSEDCNSYIPEIDTNIKLVVNPNPLIDHFTVSFNPYRKISNYEIYVYDIFGVKHTLQIQNLENKNRVDASNLVPGLYIVEVSDQNKILGRTKIIKE